MKIAVITVLLALASVCRAQQPIPIQSVPAKTPAIPLFVSCDLTAEFITPGMDAREVLWLGTPVSREGARMLEESRRKFVVSQVPLVLNADASNRMDAIVAPLDARSGAPRGRIQLLASTKSGLHETASSVAPRTRTITSTWVRIRGLYGR